jgi:hypothetical protein
MTEKKSARLLTGELKRKTRKNYSSKDKIRIIIEVMSASDSFQDKTTAVN